ncbi:MAG: PorT family protein [Bacteroidales bacterium]|nr:PorT family protein [Bacteroidales bacterium]MCF8402469.1 PorT family protein [Bacteroidales bacterium]
MKIQTLLAKTLIFFILLVFSCFSYGQKVENMPTYDYQKYHFGFILAVNEMHFTIKPFEGLNYTVFDSLYSSDINADSSLIYSIEHSPSIGFTVGIVANLRLSKYFDLRFIPSLAFGERNLEYRFLKYRDFQPGDSKEFVSITKNIPSTFVELPLHVKYKSMRQGNMRAYLLGGTNFRIDLASQANKNKDAAEVQVKLLRSDIYGELGVGFDFYFEWFKFGTELKMSYGVLDILKKEQNIYTEGIDKMRSKIFQLSFTFE